MGNLDSCRWFGKYGFGKLAVFSKVDTSQTAGTLPLSEGGKQWQHLLVL